MAADAGRAPPRTLRLPPTFPLNTAWHIRDLRRTAGYIAVGDAVGSDILVEFEDSPNIHRWALSRRGGFTEARVPTVHR